jgi:hypothetical protein
MMENGVRLPGYKLVSKRATRQWVDEEKARIILRDHLRKEELLVTKLVSPAQAEKALRKRNLYLPSDLVVSVSTGNTIAPEDDPRPEALQIGAHLRAALGKLS